MSAPARFVHTRGTDGYRDRRRARSSARYLHRRVAQHGELHYRLRRQ